MLSLQQIKWGFSAQINRLAAREIDLPVLEGILEDFRITNERLLVVYSSWENLRLAAPPNQLIELLRSRLAPEGCLAFPTAPFKDRLKDYLLPNPVFDLQRTPSCRGLLTEIARRRKDSRRTPQPGCPYSLIGKSAGQYAEMQKDLTSPYSEDSFLAEVHRQNGLILTLGVNFIWNSGVHYAEKKQDEKLRVFSKERLPYSIKNGTTTIATESEYLHVCQRDWQFIHRAYRRRPSFSEIRRYGVDYSCVRETDSFAVFTEAIDRGYIRKCE